MLSMSMIGVCSRIEIEKIASTFLAAGGDFVLFPEKNDFDNIKAALANGKLTVERLKDAVRRILILKEKAKLFDNKSVKMGDPESVNAELIEISQEAENSYVGVSCGKLDQSCEVYCKKNHLLYMDLQNDLYEHIPSTDEDITLSGVS